MNQISEKSTHISSIIQPKYQKSGLTNERAQEYKKILLEFMDKEKPYRDNGLTLNQLGAMVNISPHNLSEIFNTQFHQNFFDFINSYRLEDVKQALIDGSKQHLTILALAFDAGFNSKTSFNTIFKKYVHMTPSEYRSKAYNNLFKLS
ncbi:AraC family transcriptional regulator [candidate division KSB1 bacterium]|nr:AraC family transcriptional regulator [candidate division KSB1 bacterium]